MGNDNGINRKTAARDTEGQPENLEIRNTIRHNSTETKVRRKKETGGINTKGGRITDVLVCVCICQRKEEAGEGKGRNMTGLWRGSTKPARRHWEKEGRVRVK